MGSKRTRKGGKRRRVIANYFGTCSRLHGRQKTRCLLDKKRGFWDALGFKDDEYHIYEDDTAREEFSKKLHEYDPKIQRRIQRYLLNNNNKQKREKYLENHSESADEMSADLDKMLNQLTQPSSETLKKGEKTPLYEEYYNGHYYLYDEPRPANFNTLDFSAKSKWHREHLKVKAHDSLAGEQASP